MLPATTGLLSLALTAASIVYARRRALLDHPGQRRSHTVATPRGGGIGAVLAVLCVWALGHATSLLPAAAPWPWSFLLGLLLIAGIGWWDDHRPLSPISRLAVHAIGAACLALGWVEGLGPSSSVWVLGLVAVVVTMVAVNACNFMDGINGLASTQVALCGVAIALAGTGGPGEPSLAVPFSTAMAAAALGFLPFNFPRARIFLGDVGSGFFGAAVALMLLLAWGEDLAPPALLLLLPSAFLLDAGLTLMRRVFAGRRWYRAHREHLYQWLVRSGMTHTRVTLIYALWTASMAALLLAAPAQAWLWAAAAYALGVALWWRGKRWCLVRAAQGRIA
ncbi:MAG: hypothetical protein KDJ14_14335 [Xanthomonadales bacterium]|nr:hypothetical protein [Xanthomonadales bacterium]